jgi:hypothetical protein
MAFPAMDEAGASAALARFTNDFGRPVPDFRARA